MKRIIDYITGRQVWSKNPEKTVKEILHYHNSTFVKNDEIHYPEYAFAEDRGDEIIIRKMKKL